MRHSRSILAATIALSAAACGQGATEPSALTTISGGTRAPSPSFNVGEGEGGGQFSEDGNVSTTNAAGTDSVTIIGGSGGRGLQYGGGQ